MDLGKQIELPVKLVSQPDESNLCGPACVAMLSNFYLNSNWIAEEECQALGFDPKTCEYTYAPHLGSLLISRGLTVNIYNPNHRYGQDIDEKEAPEVKYFQEFESLGGKVLQIEDYKKLFYSELQSNRPLVVLINSNLLINPPRWPGEQGMHFVVIIGMNEEGLVILDPYPDDFGGRQVYPLQHFIDTIQRTREKTIDGELSDLDNGSVMSVSS